MWLRLRQVALVAPELEPVLEDLHAVFGLEVAYRDPSVAQFGLVNAVLPVGSQFLEVVAPVAPATAAGRYLQRRHGSGGYMVITHTDDHAARRARVDALGVRSVFDTVHDGYRCLQLHPADTGGSFLEIDYQPGGEDPNGPWAPAGPRWRDAVRREVVDAIVGVEIQADDPLRVGRRWAEITELPLAVALPPADAAGELALENASLRFVVGHDGRGDGLAAVRLSAVDPDTALFAAKRRGCRDHSGAIAVCGVRFDLVGPGGETVSAPTQRK
jgi:hypothetical protein